jgi:hypothetical protein
MVVPALIVGLEIQISQRCCFAFLEQKYFLDSLAEGARNLKSEWQTRVVHGGFNSVDRSACDSDTGSKFGLRSFLLRSQQARPGLHR